MFLRRTSPFRLAQSSRSFSTASALSFTVRRVAVDDDTLIRKKAENDAIIKRQLADEIRRRGIKEVYRRSINAYKQERHGQKTSSVEPVPVRFSHPLMVIDVANFMKNLHEAKYFSHAFAAKDLHADLRKAATVDGQKPKTVNVEVAPDTSPELEIALVLEKVFRTGSYEGTVGSKDFWIRTIHALDTQAFNQNAGDDAIALAVERAREEDRQVTLVSDDKELRERVMRMGARCLPTKKFLRELEIAKGIQYDEQWSESRLWKRLEVVDRGSSRTTEGASTTNHSNSERAESQESEAVTTSENSASEQLANPRFNRDVSEPPTWNATRLRKSINTHSNASDDQVSRKTIGSDSSVPRKTNKFKSQQRSRNRS